MLADCRWWLVTYGDGGKQAIEVPTWRKERREKRNNEEDKGSRNDERNTRITRETRSSRKKNITVAKSEISLVNSFYNIK